MKTQLFKTYEIQQKQLLEEGSQLYRPTSKSRKKDPNKNNFTLKGTRKKKKKTKPKVSRRKEIIKNRVEINEIQSKKISRKDQ